MDDFNEAMFKTKVDNIFVKIMTAVMLKDLPAIKHFVSDEVYNNLENKVSILKENNESQIYDELNVKDSIILNRQIDDDKEIVKTKIVSRYMDYVIDDNTGKVIRGDNTRRILRDYELTFLKKINVKTSGIVKKCPGCGASISVNTTGKCEYCDTIYNLEDYDYILVSISEI